MCFQAGLWKEIVAWWMTAVLCVGFRAIQGWKALSGRSGDVERRPLEARRRSTLNIAAKTSSRLRGNDRGNVYEEMCPKNRKEMYLIFMAFFPDFRNFVAQL